MLGDINVATLSTNCWHEKPESTILLPLKGEIGYELLLSERQTVVKCICESGSGL